MHNKIKNIDQIYKVEMNFVDEFELSRNGMIKEIKTEFNIIRLCLCEKNKLNEEYSKMLNRILVMPLRKLLCERNSVLLNVCPSFKMPHLEGTTVLISDNQIMIRPPFGVGPIDKWIGVNEWLQQKISWFNRDVNNMAQIIPQYSYDSIIRKLNGREYRLLKPKFETLFYREKVEFHHEISEVYFKQNPDDESLNREIYEILDKIGVTVQPLT